MRKYRWLWLLVLVDVIFIAAIWFNLTPLVRGPDEWRWSLRSSQVSPWLILIPCLTLLVYLWAASRWLNLFNRAEPGPTRRFEIGFIVFLMLAAPLIQVMLAAAVWRSPLFEFFTDTVSPSVTGFHSVAVTTPNLLDQLGHYSDFMATLPIHPQTHPPGLVLIHWVGWQVMESLKNVADTLGTSLRTLQCHNVALMTLDNAQIASAVVGMLTPVIGGLAVWPLYALGKQLIGARRAALAALVYPVLPMFAMWPSQWDQVYPLFMLTGLYLVHVGLERRSYRRLFIAGVIFSVATFLSAGNAVMIAIAGLYAGVWWLSRVPMRQLFQWSNAKHWIRQALLAGLGCLSVWVAYAVIYHIDVSELFTHASKLAVESSRCPMCPSTTRTYGTWVVWNVLDFGVFLTLPLVALLIYRLPLFMRAALDTLRQRRLSAWGPLVVATLATFIALDLAGIVRGEVSRIFAFFAPLMLMLAFIPDPRVPDRLSRRAPILIGLVALQLVVMNTRWQPYPSFLDEPPLRTANFTSPQPQTEVHLVFGHKLELVGYDYALTAAKIDLTLYWQALAQPDYSYTVFVHALDANGQLVAQQDNVPVNAQLPTSCWQTDEYVADPYSITLPPNVRGPISIEVGLYRVDTGSRLAREDGQGTSLKLNPSPARF